MPAALILFRIPLACIVLAKTHGLASKGPFGEVLRATGSMATANPFRFSTKYQDDETGLFYYGYRYYDPSTGRWLSRDPIGEVGGLNLYSMALNDVVSDVDVNGLQGLKFRSYGYTFLDAGGPTVGHDSKSKTSETPFAWIDQSKTVRKAWYNKEPGICNSTIQKGSAKHPNSYVLAEVINTEKCSVWVSCRCTVSYHIKLWAPVNSALGTSNAKLADIFGHVLGVSLYAKYPPVTGSTQSVAEGSDTKVVGLSFRLASGKSRELYYAAPNLASVGDGAGFSEKVDANCNCRIVNGPEQ